LSEFIRAFIAAPLPPEIKIAMGRIQQKLAGVEADIQWVKPELMHITLKFLGSVPSAQITAIFDSLNGRLAAQPVIKLCTGLPGAFPSRKRPRILWVGLQPDGLAPLRGLQRLVEESVAELGFSAEERKFNPHLTLGRLRSPRRIERLIKEFYALRVPAMDFKVNEVQIMRSKLSREGPAYTRLHSIVLRD